MEGNDGGEPRRLEILVVDDEPDIVFAVKTVLEMAGYDVLTAHDGVQALAQLSGRRRPDLVILDVMMPKVDGWDVLRLMRASEAWEDIPVVMLTALGEDHHQARGWVLGADWYQKKPFLPRDLITVVERLTEMNGETRTPREDSVCP